MRKNAGTYINFRKPIATLSYDDGKLLTVALPEETNSIVYGIV
jgi:hypothetical protein